MVQFRSLVPESTHELYIVGNSHLDCHSWEFNTPISSFPTAFAGAPGPLSLPPCCSFCSGPSLSSQLILYTSLAPLVTFAKLTHLLPFVEPFLPRLEKVSFTHSPWEFWTIPCGRMGMAAHVTGTVMLQMPGAPLRPWVSASETSCVHRQFSRAHWRVPKDRPVFTTGTEIK